jgi:hypothetical protein
VDGNGGSCGRSATPAAYVDGQACGSFNAAYQAAKPGDLVLVQSGSYGAVSISAKASAAAPNVVIQTAPGASVSFSSLSTGDVGTNAAGAKYFSIVGPMSGNRAELQIAAHIVLDGLTLNGQGQNDNVTYLSAVDDVTLRNMDICCNLDQKLLMIDSYRGPTTNVTVDHSSFHGQQASSTSVHMECIYDNGVVGFTVRRSTFNGCKQTGDMLITQSGTAPAPSNTLIENNIWYPSTNANGATTAYSIQSVVTGSITIRNNLFLAPMVVSSNGSNYRMSGNIGYQGSCPGGVTYSHNIWVDAKCSSSDSQNSAILSPTFYVASASGNWHYKATNPAINAGDPASYPANDLDGNKRPAGTAPDAGPYEAG